MNINNRFCTLVGHEQLQATHICIFEDCKLLQRVCCIQCINEGIHNHGKSDPEHIIQQQAIENNFQKNDKNKKNEPIEFSKREYKMKEIDYYQKKKHYRTAQLSNNEKYLAYGGQDMILRIYDIQEDRIIKQIKFDRSIYVCQFTFDSSKLYVGCPFDDINDEQEYAKVIVFDVQKNFKKILQQNILSIICNMTTIQNQYLITSHEFKIIKIDIKRKKQLFKLIGKNRENAIDYDLNTDFTINGSHDRSIKLWDCCRRRLIINKKQAHLSDIFQIQFINDTQYVLSLDNYNLYKWSIDLTNNNLIKIKEYDNHRCISGFYQINYNQNLLLICHYDVKIIDEKGQTINQIDLQWSGSYCKHQSSQITRECKIYSYCEIWLNLASLSSRVSVIK